MRIAATRNPTETPRPMKSRALRSLCIAITCLSLWHVGIADGLAQLNEPLAHVWRQLATTGGKVVEVKGKGIAIAPNGFPSVVWYAHGDFLLRVGDRVKDFREFAEQWEKVSAESVSSSVLEGLATDGFGESLTDEDVDERNAYVISAASRIAMAMLAEYHEWLTQEDS